jgi:hypothetical protein
MTPQDVDLRQLGDEIKELASLGTPCASFYLKPFEAYTLIACLHGMSRNPTLTNTQRRIVVSFARQIADQLIAFCRAVLGPDSLIERTIEMGFDPRHDIPRSAHVSD